MKILCIGFLGLMLCTMVHAQTPTDEQRIEALLTGRKNPNDQEVVAGLEIGSLDILSDQLAKEQSPNKLPLFARLIGTKYRQFSKDIPSDKQTKILTALTARIRAIEQDQPGGYLIQSALSNLHGINHPAVTELARSYQSSDSEWTKKAAQALLDSNYQKDPSESGAPVAPVIPLSGGSVPSSEEPSSGLALTPIGNKVDSNPVWLWIAGAIVILSTALLVLKRRG